MNAAKAIQLRKAGGINQTLIKRERDYVDAWDPNSEWAKEAAKMGIFPDLAKEGQPLMRESRYDHDPFTIIPAPESVRHHDDPSSREEASIDAAEAILKVLYILSGSSHPGLKLATDCLLAIINRTEERSQAAIARKYNLTRSAVSKRMRELRKGDLGNLSIYLFGGRKEVSEKARARATRVHQERKAKCKTTNTISQLLAAI